MTSAGQVQSFFQDTCVPIEYRCTVNDKYIDPCNCTYFYQCESAFRIIRRPCSPGTGFNHKNNFCASLQELVVDGLCDLNKPWKRCSDVEDDDDVDEGALERRCSGGGGSGGGVDGGLIAGVIIAILIVAIIVIALIIYVRKRGNPIGHLKESRVWRSITGKDTGGDQQQSRSAGQSSAPRYGHGQGDEETYAEIDDTALYKDPSGGGKPQARTQLSHTNETYDREDVEERVTYDNRALQREDTSHPLPPLPPPQDAGPPQIYSPLEEREPAVIGSYASLLEHRATAITTITTAGSGTAARDSKELMTGEDDYLKAKPFGGTPRNSSPLEPFGGTPRNSSPLDPDYFVLEKS